MYCKDNFVFVYRKLLIERFLADVPKEMGQRYNAMLFNRKTARDAGVPAANAFERWVDTNYTDEFISSRFQNMVIESGAPQQDQSGEAAQ